MTLPRQEGRGSARNDDDGLAAALIDPGPRPELAADLELFGRFVGRWRLACTWFAPTGEEAAHGHGDLRFGWVLGGRAVQDVWDVPGLDHPGADGAGRGFHGTTVRFYDPGVRAWRSTWLDPLNNRVRRFRGVSTDAGIELVSDEEQPALRWSFSDVTPDSFVWTGEQATPDRPEWLLRLRMVAARVPVSASA